jgi:trans-aconitate 2-methyltransferase
MGYKWDAGEYDRNAAFQRGLAAELIGKLRLRGNERVLDVGCGDGKNTKDIASLLSKGSVLGIDASEDMVTHARKTYPPSSNPNLRFDIKDVLEMVYCSEFDVVFSNAALHWVKDHRTMLKRISASLKVGGRILLQMGGRGNAKETFEVLKEKMDSEEWRTYFIGFVSPFGFYAPEDYGPWLKEAGLQSNRVQLVEKDMIQDGLEGLKGWIRTTWLPYTQRVPEGRREEFIEGVAKELIRRHPLDKDGKAHLKMVRLEVEAGKK